MPRPSVFDRGDAEIIAATALARALYTWDGVRSLSVYALPPMRSAVRRAAQSHAGVTAAPCPRAGEKLRDKLAGFGLLEASVDLGVIDCGTLDANGAPQRLAERADFWTTACSACRDDIDLAILAGLSRGDTCVLMARDVGCSVGTVHTRAKRLKEALRESLADRLNARR